MTTKDLWENDLKAFEEGYIAEEEKRKKIMNAKPKVIKAAVKTGAKGKKGKKGPNDGAAVAPVIQKDWAELQPVLPKPPKGKKLKDENDMIFELGFGEDN